MKELIRQQALALGFDDCCFSTAAGSDRAGAFREWLQAGYHGTMDYLARRADERCDPQRLLPGARTVVVVAAAYPHDPAPSDTAESSSQPHWPGKIARYARATDYHTVLAEPLRALASLIEQQGGPGTRTLACVDTRPVLERDFGERAGLGFVGKHTNLINRRLGNWFLLGEILTTVELAPDAPESPRCGKCTRCLAACPTGALTQPYRLDARLCISYLTIELKGPIPEPLRPAIGNRIFGCDDCLEVCPWNRFARLGRWGRLSGWQQAHGRRDLDQPDLLELLRLDDAAFRARFRETPLWRGRRRRLLRNVCVALGNQGDAAALPALERARQDPEPLIAEHARWAVERLK